MGRGDSPSRRLGPERGSLSPVEFLIAGGRLCADCGLLGPSVGGRNSRDLSRAGLAGSARHLEVVGGPSDIAWALPGHIVNAGLWDLDPCSGWRRRGLVIVSVPYQSKEQLRRQLRERLVRMNRLEHSLKGGPPGIAKDKGDIRAPAWGLVVGLLELRVLRLRWYLGGCFTFPGLGLPDRCQGVLTP
ncbi:hypothetical protein NDU88_003354 [Pleurodeles waltl]|uniref:Uncharacterized protein n=1 Tax=Pleurodeles waltl TaxID=8319 RepID=A0AAV7PCG2_PLEWA|nr:hypothetical protein NDU88_003354 [Pleurodeles waltl]